MTRLFIPARKGRSLLRGTHGSDVSQGLDRVEVRGAIGWVQPKHYPDAYREEEGQEYRWPMHLRWQVRLKHELRRQRGEKHNRQPHQYADQPADGRLYH